MEVRLKGIMDFTAEVVVIDQNSGRRDVVVKSLKDAGYNNVNRVSSLDQFLATESTEFQWVIVPLFQEFVPNSVQFIRDFYDKKICSKTVFSLILNEKDFQCLPKAYEFGLLSHHKADYSINHLNRQWVQIVSKIIQHKTEVFVSASYFREVCQDLELWDEGVSLEKALVDKNPRDQVGRTLLAKALYQANRTNEARRVLDDMCYFDAKIGDKIAKIREKFDPEREESKSFAQENNFHSVYIIDPDASSNNIIIGALQKMGLEEIHTFSDGEEAWDALTEGKNPPDLILLEWKLGKIPGPFLIQRVRDAGFHLTPLIVVSSTLSKNDAQLVKEMTVSQVLHKPLRDKQVSMAIAWTMVQDRMPSEIKTLERKIIQLLNFGNLQEAKAKIAAFKNCMHVNESRIKYVEGALLYQQGNYKEATQVLKESLDIAITDSVEVIGLLARCALKLGDYVTSTTLLEKASVLSPHNINRLCTLAESKLEQGNGKDAEDFLARAKSLDSSSPRVINTDIKKSLLDHDIERAKELMESFGNKDDVIAFMNNQAIVYIKTQRLAEGITLYQDTLKALPEKATENRAIVSYNLGLALIKMEKNDEASTVLKEAISLGETRIYERAMRVLSQVNKARKASKKPQLAINQKDTVNLESELDPGIRSPGIRSLYQVSSDLQFSPNLLILKKNNQKKKLAS